MKAQKRCSTRCIKLDIHAFWEKMFQDFAKIFPFDCYKKLAHNICAFIFKTKLSAIIQAVMFLNVSRITK